MAVLKLCLISLIIGSAFGAPDFSQYPHSSRFLAEYSIFKIDIQYISLHTQKKYGSPDELITSPDKKAIKIEYLRELSKKILKQAWDVSFDSVLSKKEKEKYKSEIKQMKSVARTVKKGDVVSVEFDDQGYDYFFNGKKLTRVEGGDFARKTLGIWIGKKAVDDDMKKGMLKNNLYKQNIGKERGKK